MSDDAAAPVLRREAVIASMLRKQHLARGARADRVSTVLTDLIGLHATHPRSPYLQLRARIGSFADRDLDVLLDSGSAAKIACMRGTLFIESAELIPMLLAATRSLMARGHDRYLADNGLNRRRYEQLARRIEEALADGAALDGRQLRAALGADDAVPAVVHVLCDEGRLVRWKGKRGWDGPTQTYRLFGQAVCAVRAQAWDESHALRELVRRYVRS